MKSAKSESKLVLRSIVWKIDHSALQQLQPGYHVYQVCSCFSVCHDTAMMEKEKPGYKISSCATKLHFYVSSYSPSKTPFYWNPLAIKETLPAVKSFLFCTNFDLMHSSLLKFSTDLLCFIALHTRFIFQQLISFQSLEHVYNFSMWRPNSITTIKISDKENIWQIGQK